MSEPLSSRYPRMDQEMAATDPEFVALGMHEGEAMVVARLTREALDRMPQFQVLDFLVRMNGAVYFGNKHWMLAGSGQAGRRGGAQALAAGEFCRVNDQIWFNLGSGTYGPTEERVPIVVQAFAQLGYHAVFKGLTNALPQRSA